MSDKLHEIGFSDPNMFGPEFDQKVQAHKDQKVANAGGEINPMKGMNALKRVIQLEKPHIAELDRLAVETTKRLFPVIEDSNLEIDAKIVPFSTIHLPTPAKPKQITSNDPMFKKAAKKKIMNAISQAAGVSMNSAHHAVDRLDTISPELKTLYDDVYKTNDAIYHTIDKENLLRMATQQSATGMVGGSAKIEFRNGNPIIIARGISFVYLMHEIIKGVYEYLGLHGYESNDQFKDASQYSNSLSDEIEDITTGEIIRNSLRDYLLDNHDDLYQHPSFFEMFLVQLAKQEEDEMVALVNGIIRGLPNRRRLEQIARDTFYILRDFEAGKHID